MQEPRLKTLSPTARILFWFRKYQRAVDVTEMSVNDVSERSGIPVSSLYRAARELDASITRQGSVMEM